MFILPHKRDFADRIKLRILRWGEDPGLSGSGGWGGVVLHIITGSLEEGGWKFGVRKARERDDKTLGFWRRRRRTEPRTGDGPQGLRRARCCSLPRASGAGGS